MFEIPAVVLYWHEQAEAGRLRPVRCEMVKLCSAEEPMRRNGVDSVAGSLPSRRALRKTTSLHGDNGHRRTARERQCSSQGFPVALAEEVRGVRNASARG